MKVALTIAGSDSGGGAGIQADLKSMQANGVFAASVITAVTAQNTRAVTAAFDLPIEIIEAQIDAVMSDIQVDATKTGMLSSIAIIEAVARKVREHWMFPLVVDPVMISKSGFALLKPDAVGALRTLLLPLATVVTPNAHEAERLAEMEIRTADDAARAARRLHRMGPGAVLVKGGHLEGEEQALDVLFDGQDEHRIASRRIDTPHTHGTGCTYASAIAANLAKGYDLVTAVQRAKRYLIGAIENGLPIGAGHGPTHHFWYLEPFGGLPDER
ncbi:MAG: bifunctional hydroxymethylpyrimidine kinase/phosphomethylpyrimidine kinase [Deltaproteobacteria bacterium]|nr:bifunctional hydroxymethylpyrimidine kinase/phosphomethylpyrimidine kinase [Deltaproteobacteria bacterium]